MKDTDPSPVGGEGKEVQADETYTGITSKRAKHYKKGHCHKEQIVALVEPDKGKVRAFHVKTANLESVSKILFTLVDRKSTLVTDKARLYQYLGPNFAKHEKVDHRRREYVNKNGFGTNNVENFFGNLKRAMKAHIVISEQHLHRYVAENTFRYSNRTISDFERAEEALKGIEGKRLTYRRINGSEDASSVG